MSRSGGALGLLLLAGALSVRAETEFVNVELQPEKITVGDPVKVRLLLVWDGAEPTTTPIFPDWKEKTWGRAEVLERGRVEAVPGLAGRRIYSQTLTLTAFETGEFELPPREVTILLPDDEIAVVPTREGVRFTVESVLPAEVEDAAALEPRPPAPLSELEANRYFLWTSAALTALSALAWVVAARRADKAARAAAARAAPRPPPGPLEEILAALRRIDVRGGSEPVHTAMSLALRRFLARLFRFNAVESTTSEIERVLRRRSLSEELAEGAVDLLRDCDQVKYARLEVGDDLVAERLAFLGDLAQEIDRELRPPQPEVPDSE